MENSGLPSREGFYWARWQKPASGTADEGEMCCPEQWEVVQVFTNGWRTDSPHYYMVFVAGVEKAQPLDHFVWGPEVIRPASLDDTAQGAGA